MASLRPGRRRQRRCGSRLSCSSLPSSLRSRSTRSPRATGPGCDRSPGSPVIAVLVAVPWRRIVVARGGELSAENVLGAYTPSARPPASTAIVCVAVLWHAFDIAILGFAIPVLAIAALALHMLARRDNDPALRAFVAVTLAYVTLLVLQVGLFAAEYVESRCGALPHHGAAAPRDRAVHVDRMRSAAVARRRPPRVGAARRRCGADPDWSRSRTEHPRQHAHPLGAGGALGRLGTGGPRRRGDPRGGDRGGGPPPLGVDGRRARRRHAGASRRTRAAAGSSTRRRTKIGRRWARALDVAGRRGAGGRHAAGHRGSSLDVDRAHRVLEPRRRRGAPHPSGRAARFRR